MRIPLPDLAATAALGARIAAVLQPGDVVALSGGYSREEANAKLAQNTGIIASFSRALTEGLSAQQPDADFDAVLGDTVKTIHAASIAG